MANGVSTQRRTYTPTEALEIADIAFRLGRRIAEFNHGDPLFVEAELRRMGPYREIFEPFIAKLGHENNLYRQLFELYEFKIPNTE